MARWDQYERVGQALSGDDTALVRDQQSGKVRRATVEQLRGGAGTTPSSLLAALANVENALRSELPNMRLLGVLDGRLEFLPGAVVQDEIDDRSSAEDGTDGTDGWTPLFRGASDGARRGLEVYDWAGGGGAKPATGYVGATGLVAAKADMLDLRGPAGQGGGPGAAVQPATEAEAEGGSVADKYVSPLTLGEVFTHRKAAASAVASDGDGGEDLWTPADVVRLAVAAKLDKTGLLAALLALQLSEREKSALRALIGALAPEGEPTAPSDEELVQRPHVPGVMQATRYRLPEGASAFQITLNGTFPGGRIDPDGAFVTTWISASEFLALPAVDADSNGFGAQANRVIEQRLTGGPDDAPYRIVLGHGAGADARLVWVSTDNNDLNTTFRGRSRTAGVEDYALVGTTARLPAGRQTAGWEQFTVAMEAKLAGIADGAQANVKADLAAAAGSAAEVLGKAGFVASILAQVRSSLAALPSADPASTLFDVVEESSGRKDAQIEFANVGGSEYWGSGRGTTAPATPDAAHFETVVRGVRWRPGTRLLTLWLAGDDVETWDRAAIDNQFFRFADDGDRAVPWDTSLRPALVRQVSVTLTPDQAVLIADDPRKVFRLNVIDAAGGPVVGAAFVRPARTPRAGARYPTGRSLPADPVDGQHFVLSADVTWQLVGVLQAANAANGWQNEAQLPASVSRIYFATAGTLANRLVVVRRANQTFDYASVQLGDGDVLPLINAPRLPGGVGNPYQLEWVTAPLAGNPITTAETYARLLDNAGSSAFGQRVLRAGITAVFATPNWQAADAGATLQEVRTEVAAEFARRRVETTQAAYDALGPGRPSDVEYWITG